jgi:hypothetical protein
MRALNTLRRHFRSLYFDELAIVYDDQLVGQDLGGRTMITLGGPFANRVYARLAESLSVSFALQSASPEHFGIVDRATGELLTPERNADGSVTRDYGLIIRARNPLGSRQKSHFVYVLLAALDMALRPQSNTRLTTDS